MRLRKTDSTRTLEAARRSSLVDWRPSEPRSRQKRGGTHALITPLGPQIFNDLSHTTHRGCNSTVISLTRSQTNGLGWRSRDKHSDRSTSTGRRYRQTSPARQRSSPKPRDRAKRWPRRHADALWEPQARGRPKRTKAGPAVSCSVSAARLKSSTQAVGDGKRGCQPRVPRWGSRFIVEKEGRHD